MSESKPPIYWISDYLTPDDILNHAVHKVILHKHTQFQEMWIVDCGTYGKGLILDGIWQSSTGDDFLYHESLVQPACVNHGDPKRGLVLGGGEGATIRELLKWKNMERVVMVDLDREVVEACKEHFPEMHQGAFFVVLELTGPHRVSDPGHEGFCSGRRAFLRLGRLSRLMWAHGWPEGGDGCTWRKCRGGDGALHQRGRLTKRQHPIIVLAWSRLCWLQNSLRRLVSQWDGF